MYSVLMKLNCNCMDSACFMCVSQQQASFSHSVVTFFVEETNVFLIKYDKWLVCSTTFFV